MIDEIPDYIKEVGQRLTPEEREKAHIAANFILWGSADFINYDEWDVLDKIADMLVELDPEDESKKGLQKFMKGKLAVVRLAKVIDMEIGRKGKAQDIAELLEEING